MSYENPPQPVSFDSVNSCLFIGTAGHLFQVYCPFRVVCQIAYPPYRVGDRLVVNRIGTGPDQDVLYQIGQQYRPHYLFGLSV